MPSAKIIFIPKVGTEEYCMQNVEIVDKYYEWTLDTSDFVEYGYVQTQNVTDVNNLINSYWIRFRPKDGYKFKNVYKTDYYGTSNNGAIYPQGDGTIFIYPWEKGNAVILNNYLYVELEATGEIITYDVTTSLTNCVCNNATSYVENSNITLTLEADDEYVFNEIPYITMNDNKYYFILNEDETTATLDIIVTGNIEIVAKAGLKGYNLNLNLTNCTCNLTSVVKGYNTIILTAISGCEFESNVELFDNSIGVTMVYNDFTNSNTICIIEYEVTGDITITAKANLKVNQINSFVNLYKVTDDVLTELSKVRFQDDVDYGKFITSLIRIPFDLPIELLSDNKAIQLGVYDSGVKSTSINDYILNIGLGEISVNEKYSNVYDYKDTECILHLPYCEDIKINTEYVINHKINITYKIDLYSGNCTVNITSDFTNEIVASKNFSVGAKIPFIQEDSNTVVNNVDNVLDNGLRTAFMEVVRNIPYDVNSPFGKETVDYGMIGNYTGYIKVSDVVLNVNATADEKTEIETLLKNGICILK